MSKGVYYNGTATQGALDSAITIGVGDSIEFDFMSREYAVGSAVDSAIVSNATGSDAIMPQHANASNSFELGIRLDGTTYKSADQVLGIWDGNVHEMVVKRKTPTLWEWSVDGEVHNITTGSGTFTVEFTGVDKATAGYIEMFVGNLVIAGVAYPYPSSDETELVSVPHGNNILMTQPAFVSIGRWEWVGDFVHIDKEYTTQNGTKTEKRKDGTRRRCIANMSMSNANLKQVGSEETTVVAYNGGVETIMTPDDAGAVTVDCDEETFSPLLGTGLFWQTQKWTSWKIVSA